MVAKNAILNANKEASAIGAVLMVGAVEKIGLKMDVMVLLEVLQIINISKASMFGFSPNY